jgi:23S rRNA (uracil1939-C5)-methyltransferase
MTVRIATKESTAAALIVFWTNGGERRQIRRLARLLMEGCSHVAGVVRISASRRDFQAQHETPVDLVAGTDVLEQELSGHVYLIGPTTFFQVNLAQAAHLVQKVRQVVLERQATHILDLFCGVGLFSIGIADLVDSIHGIETSIAAIQLARRAAEDANLSHKVKFSRADALRRHPQQLTGYDLIIVDPPRSGLSTTLLESIASSTVRTLVYISCEPSTLARDVKQLIAAQWSLSQIQIIDLFPQTYHVESLAVFSRLR